MRDAALFALVSVVHTVTSVVLVIYVFGAGMARFDTGTAATPMETAGGWLLNVLSLPLLFVLERMPAVQFPGRWGYVPFVVNASVWGLGAVLIRRRSQRRRSGTLD